MTGGGRLFEKLPDAEEGYFAGRVTSLERFRPGISNY